MEGDEDEHGVPYLLSPYSGEKFLEQVLQYTELVNLDHLEVDADRRGEGIGLELVNRAIAAAKKSYPGVPMYINASPFGMDSIQLDDLIKLYSKAGFKVLKKYAQHRNAFMWKAA